MLRWLTVAVLVGSCGGPKPDCPGCIAKDGACLEGTSSRACGLFGRACLNCSFASKVCSAGYCVEPYDAGSGWQGGGGAGGQAVDAGPQRGGGAAGGGAAEPSSVFVTVRFDSATCCTNGCACMQCRLEPTCVVTKLLTRERFNELRLTDLSACRVSQSAADQYIADCAGRCTSYQSGCVVNGTTYADTVITCQPIAGTTPIPCGWSP